MVKLVGAPPDNVHDNVVDCPLVIVSRSAVNELITGACGLTVIVIAHEYKPEEFEAVKI